MDPPMDPPPWTPPLLTPPLRGLIGMMRLEVDAGKKTEDQTFQEAMKDPLIRRYLKRTGMPMPPG